MHDTEKAITRRDFLRGAAYAAVATTIGLPALRAEETTPKTLTKVVLVRDKKVVDDKGNLDAQVIKRMLDDGITELFGAEEPPAAWEQIVAPDDIVGIKSNVWGPLPTPESVESAIATGVMSAGVDRKNIDISDRGVLDSEIFRKATALINVRPMRTHHWSGVGGLLKNYIMFVRRPQDYHDNSCAPLAKLWELPIVKGKTRLNVLLMLTPQFHCIGPHHFDPEFVWAYKGLLVGIDPVAVDSVGLSIIQAQRNKYFEKESPLKPPAHHILFADVEHKLGTADPEKIDLVKLGWEEDILI